MTVTRSTTTAERMYACDLAPGRGELWCTSFAEYDVHVFSLGDLSRIAQVAVGPAPMGIVIDPSETRAYVSITETDAVIAIDLATRAIVDSQPIGESSMLGADGMPLHASSPSGLALDAASDALYVVRAADNAVTVLDPQTLSPRGSIPTGWYPTAVALAAGGAQLVIANGKGLGVGPYGVPPDDTYSGPGDYHARGLMSGTIQIVQTAGLDLSAGQAQGEANIRRPATFYEGWDCDGTFPVPPRLGMRTPVEHVVVIVRENKTYDVVLGDLGVPEANGRPDLTLYGEDVTPNLHALARRYTNADNFYTDGEVSSTGHLWLTTGLVVDFMERHWIEDYRDHAGFNTDPGLPRGYPDYGNFFSHLLENGIDVRIYGEATGALAGTGRGRVFPHVDLPFGFFTLDVLDEDKVERVIGHIEAGDLEPFTYLLLPNDHTGGGLRLSAESMISDNDYATALVIDALSHSPMWDSTVVFVVQDDTQIGADHVDYHRGPLVVVSPWARRGHTMHVHASFPSLLHTIELIFGVPPFNRFTASAVPLFDAFTTTPDFTPYDALPRRIGNIPRAARGPIAGMEDAMDFGGPDRNPNLGALRWLERRGMKLPDEAQASWSIGGLMGRRSRTEEAALAEEAREDALEADMFERDIAAIRAYLLEHPELETGERTRRQLRLPRRR